MNDELKDKALQKISSVFTNVSHLPLKTGSERTAVDQVAKRGKAQSVNSSILFYDFILKLSNSRLFEAC